MLRFKRRMQKAKTWRASRRAGFLLPICAIYFACCLLVQAQKTPLALPPEPKSTSAHVKRGESVRIILRIYGAANQQLRFHIKSRPVAGSVSEPQNLDQDLAEVTYKHSGKAEPTQDHFTFVVQSSAGFSAPAHVDIEITDDPPILVVPDALDFGNLAPGAVIEQQIVLENRGGGLAEGRVETSGAWSVRGEAGYRLERGEKQQFTIVFAPQEEREYRAEIRYTGSPDRVTLLDGFGAKPFAVRPTKIELTAPRNQFVRTGTIDIENRTNQAQQATLQAGKKLRLFAANVEVPANGKARVKVESVEDAGVAGFDDAFKVQIADATFDVDVHAAAVGPIVRANAEKVWVGAAGVGPAAAATLQVENIGGTATVVHAGIDEPFAAAEGDKTFPLGPGEKRLIHISLQTREAGKFREILRVETSANQLEIPVEAESAGQENIAPTPSRESATGPLIVDRKPETLAPQPLIDSQEMLAAVASRFTVHVKHIASRSAEVEWPAKGGDAKRVFHIERRFLSLDAKRELKIDWQPVKNVEITRTNDAVSARFRNLEPGKLHTFRVVAQSSETGAAPEPLGEFQIWTTAPAKTSWRAILIGVLLAALALIAWRRFAR